jgi:hypothetical protein
VGGREEATGLDRELEDEEAELNRLACHDDEEYDYGDIPCFHCIELPPCDCVFNYLT